MIKILKETEIPDTQNFPMEKYSMLCDAVSSFFRNAMELYCAGQDNGTAAANAIRSSRLRIWGDSVFYDTSEAYSFQQLLQLLKISKGIIKNFTLMSDIFMRNVFKKRECLEYVLQVIMEKQDLHVIDQIIQKDYKNLQGRSAVMDCVARDSTGKQFDVEIQQDNEGASPKRARYHSGLMEMNTLNPGQDFEELPESYVIFITRDDILGYGLPIYHIDRQIKELEEAF